MDKLCQFCPCIVFQKNKRINLCSKKCPKSPIDIKHINHLENNKVEITGTMQNIPCPFCEHECVLDIDLVGKRFPVQDIYDTEELKAHIEDLCHACVTKKTRYKLHNTEELTCQECGESVFMVEEIKLNLCSTKCSKSNWYIIDYPDDNDTEDGFIFQQKNIEFCSTCTLPHGKFTTEFKGEVPPRPKKRRIPPQKKSRHSARIRPAN